MWEIEQLADLAAEDRTPSTICAHVAKIFRVSETEVALLELSGSMLNFLYPAELRTAGGIPLFSSAVAGPPARGKKEGFFKGVSGVIQVSRKAPRPAAAGPDFTADDLRKLKFVASIVGTLLVKIGAVAKASSV